MSWVMKFMDLVEQSVVFQGILAVSVVGAVVYLSCVGRPVPDQLSSLALIVVGFFFGSKATNSVSRANMDTIRAMKGRE